MVTAEEPLRYRIVQPGHTNPLPFNLICEMLSQLPTQVASEQPYR